MSFVELIKTGGTTSNYEEATRSWWVRKVWVGMSQF